MSPRSAPGTTLISIPSLSEQHEIVRRVESLFTYADRLAARYQAARAQVDRLTPALLAKAFRGELVPQDPTDEPAALLLERRHAARVGAGNHGPVRLRLCGPDAIKIAAGYPKLRENARPLPGLREPLGRGCGWPAGCQG